MPGPGEHRAAIAGPPGLADTSHGADSAPTVVTPAQIAGSRVAGPLDAPLRTRRHDEGRGSRSHPLLVVAALFAAGIVADRYAPAPVAAWLIVGIAALAAWFVVARRWASRDASRSPAATLATGALFAAVVACGGLRHHLHWRMFAADDIGRFARDAPQPLCAEVLALCGPRHKPAPPPDPLRSLPENAHDTLRVRAVALRDGGTWRAVEGQATMIVEGTLTGVHAGDRLRIVGQIVSPSPPGNPGEFDFALHRRGDRELAAIRVDHPDCIEVVEAAPAYSPRRMLGELRAAGDRLLWGTLSHERAGLAAAVLLGAREELDDEQKDHFLVTGTIHILSISGLHIGILAYVLFKAFRSGFVPRTPALLAVALSTLMYTLLTDSEPPALRATVLVWIACGAIYLGRAPLGLNSLALAAIIVLALNPADLFRAGTQLSFMSVAVLSAVATWWTAGRDEDALARLIRRTRPLPMQWLRRSGRNVAAAFAAGLMIWIVTAPLVLYRFNVLSLSALVLNIVLWVPVFLTMASGFGVLVFGWLVPPLGAALGAICDFNLAVIEWCIDAAAALPLSHFWLAGPPVKWLFGYYALLALPWFAPRWIDKRRSLALGGGWISIAVIYMTVHGAEPDARELVCGFVSVGHGCAAVLELPDGQVWLYDAGRLGSPRGGARSIEAYLRSRRIGRIDAIILSHADIDHYNAVPELLDKFAVGAVYVSPQMFRDKTPPLEVLRGAIVRAGVPLDTLSAGDSLAAGECLARVLHPPQAGVNGSDNANSIVLAVEYAGRRVLLTGDLESPGVERLLDQSPVDCDILLAPHHGSPRSRPAAIVHWSTPEWAVISAGHSESGSAYRLLVGTRALNTFDVGAVRVRLSSEGVDVHAWRVDPWE